MTSESGTMCQIKTSHQRTEPGIWSQSTWMLVGWKLVCPRTLLGSPDEQATWVKVLLGAGWKGQTVG